MGVASAAPLGTAPERVLAVEGARNVRDLGGYPTADGRQTRWRTLFRADSLHRLSAEGQGALIAAGVRTVVDLRRDDESRESPNPFAASADVRYVRISLQDEPLDELAGLGSLGSLYQIMLDDGRDRVAAIFGALAGPGALPAVFHCTAGKDRTGLVAALALGAVGVPREAILDDYLLSATCLGATFVDEAQAFVAKRGWSWEQVSFLWGCAPDPMASVLSYVEQRYGGIVAYLLAAGVSEREIGALRAGFTT